MCELHAELRAGALPQVRGCDAASAWCSFVGVLDSQDLLVDSAAHAHARSAVDAEGASSSAPAKRRRVKRIRRARPAPFLCERAVHLIDARDPRAEHINPLASKQVQPAVLADDWFAAAFADPGKPLIVDVGSALGEGPLGVGAREGGRRIRALLAPDAVLLLSDDEIGMNS